MIDENDDNDIENDNNIKNKTVYRPKKRKK